MKMNFFSASDSSFHDWRKRLLASSFMAAIATAGVAQAVTVHLLGGDQRVDADPSQSELGDLMVDHDTFVGHDLNVGHDLDVNAGIRFGTTTGSLSAIDMLYDAANKSSNLNATEQAAVFLWQDNTGGTAEKKLMLDGSNLLKLYKDDGSAPGLVLNPNDSTVTFSGNNGGLKHSTGGSVLRFNSSGDPIFDRKPLFGQGADFGTGGTLDSSKVGYLQGMLTDFGYQASPVTPTALSKVSSALDTYPGTVKAANGCVYFTGSITRPTQLAGLTLTPDGGESVIAKFNSSGQLQWLKQYGSSLKNMYGGFLAVNGSGDVVLATTLSGQLLNMGTPVSSVGSTDACVICLNDSDGSLQWKKVLGGVNEEDVKSVAVDSAGNVALAGTYFGGTTNVGTGTLANAGTKDAFVVKLDSNGTPLWSNSIGGAAYDLLSGVTLDTAGNVFVAGYLNASTTNLGSYNIILSGTTITTGFAAKYNSSGVIQWTKAIGGNNTTYGTAIAADASGHVFVGGEFSGTTSTLGSYNRTSVGASDGYVVGLASSDGAVQWSKAIGSTGTDRVVGLLSDSSGNVWSWGTSGGSTTTLGSYNLTSKGGADGFVVSFDSSGNALTSQAFGGTGMDSLTSLGLLQADGSAGMVLTGSAGASFRLGNGAIAAGYFSTIVANVNVVTPPTAASSLLSWGGGLATGADAVALGNNSFASGLQSAAFGGGLSQGTLAFSAGSGRAMGIGAVAMGSGSLAGNFASAFGDQSTASGIGSFAAGHSSQAIGTYSTALGDSSTAGGLAATALGRYNYITGEAAFGTGDSNGASGYASAVFGAYSYAGGDYSLAAGYGSWTGAEGAVALGTSAATGGYSTALGASSTYGDHSSALGGSIATGDYSLAGGLANSGSYGSTALGRANIGGGSASTWVEEDSLFELGNGLGVAASNAVKTRKNGETTLTNKAWKANTGHPLDDPAASNDSNGRALIVEGHTELKGKVIISEPQGDISMGIYE